MSKLTVCNECMYCEQVDITSFEDSSFKFNRVKCSGIRNFITGEKNAGVFFCEEINREGNCKFFEPKKEGKVLGAMIPDEITETYCHLTLEELLRYNPPKAAEYYVFQYGEKYKIVYQSAPKNDPQSPCDGIVFTRKLIRVKE